MKSKLMFMLNLYCQNRMVWLHTAGEICLLNCCACVLEIIPIYEGT